MIDKAELLNAVENPLKFALYFEANEHGKPHYYLILPTQNQNEALILSMITSQIDKRKNFYQNNDNALDSLIYVDETTLSFLIKPSIIDCNKAFKVDIAEVLKMDKLKLISAEIPKELIRQIAKAINHSKLVRPNIKKMIDLSLMD